ncbi:hypothetical protein [Streptomyces flaveolus]|uniref:hypothetical protein n=1 Tax=Streptomyces flaveolus TaxID=67297 RepID=UPI0034303CDE
MTRPAHSWLPSGNGGPETAPPSTAREPPRVLDRPSNDLERTSRAPGAPTPAPPQRGTRPRVRRLLRAAHRTARHAAPALGACLAVRGTGLLLLAVWAHRRHQDLWVVLAAQWDSDRYLGIADHGYARELGTALNANDLAFFPLHPVLVKAVAVLTPGTRASTGLGLAVVASLVAARGIFAVGDRLYGRRVGVLLTTLWAAFPVGAVQWMGYTESLFTACAAWSLFETDRDARSPGRRSPGRVTPRSAAPPAARLRPPPVRRSRRPSGR